MASGGQAFAWRADVSFESEAVALFDETEHRFGPLTHLVNNAGRLLQQATITGIDVERFNQVMQANVTSCFLCSREFILRNQRGGAIVNVSSSTAGTGAPFEYIDYVASKGAMDTLTKGLSLEVAARGIRVNGVCPGFIHTRMQTDGGEPNRVAQLAPQIPLQRGGTAEVVAHAIVWLLSDEASYVTGSMIDVAGCK